MPHQLNFSKDNLAQALELLKDEDAVWGEITKQMRIQLKELLETTMEAERDLLVACRRYGRSPNRQDERAGYRLRSIVTTLGRISNLKVPRLRNSRFRTRLWSPYRRRVRAIEIAVLECFVSGISTRRMKRALRSILGTGGLSSMSVSRIVTWLNRSVRQWLTSPITDDIEVLYLDGVFLRIKERGVKKRPTLFAMGITTDGRVKILGFWHAWSEDAHEWQAFLQSLWQRGLKGSCLKVVVADGAGAILAAVALLWPEANIQSCLFHKMRNLVLALKGHPLKRLIITDAKMIWQARSKAEALRRIAHFRQKWHKAHPRAVRNFLRDIDLTLTYLEMPRRMWSKIRTNNPLDRFFREIKRRVDPIGAFVDRKSASRILFAIATVYQHDQLRGNDRNRELPHATFDKINSAHF